jgi:hypothetical protein
LLLLQELRRSNKPVGAALGITPEYVRHIMSGGQAGDSEDSETGALVQAGLVVSPDAVTRYRKGDRFPSVPVATKIAHFFGWEVEETIAGLMKDLTGRDDTGA